MQGRLGLALALSLSTACSGSPSTPVTEVERPAAQASTPTDVAPVQATVDEADEPAAVGDAAPDTWVQALLERHPDKFGPLLADPGRYRLQILVSLVPDAKADPPVLEEHGYRVGAEFIYPASSIKTFASVAALRKLQDLRDGGARVGLDTPVAICRNTSRKCTVTDDETNLEGGSITLGHEIRKMQLVSDNQSFNRLYTFVGHRELNEVVWDLGFPEVRIHHRMFDVEDAKVRRTTPRMELRPAKGKPVVIPRRVSDLELPETNAPQLEIGTGYIDRDRNPVEEPMSFSQKNYASVRDLHRLIVSLVMPGAPGAVDLGLTKRHRAFLLEAMTQDPHASTNPVYTKPIHSGLRYKTMIRGMKRAMPIDRLRYVNKPGRAFGFHLDSAYIEDRKTGRAMFVTTVLYANADGILNDNAYDYDEVTRPYLKNLGEVLVRQWFLVEQQ